VNLDLNGVALTRDDRFAFTAGKDGTVKMWATRRDQMLREILLHATDITSVALTPDERLVLSASLDGTARLFDIATGAELATLASTHGGKSWAVVAPDGLFDASEQGRRLVGFRFAGKLPGASIGHLFGHFYHPGLLAELMRGERPMAKTQLGKSMPPVLRLVSPKARSLTNDQVMVTVEATDQGGGVSSPAIYNNDARLAVEPEIRREDKVTRYSFKVPLNRGVNQIRVTASSGDDSWDAVPAEVALTCTRRFDRKSRLFVVTVGVSDYAEADLKLGSAANDAKALADLLQQRGAGLYGRVDVLPLIGRDATAARIKETLKDVAALTEPQDTVALILCGRGSVLGDQFRFVPREIRLGRSSRDDDLLKQGLSVDELTAILGTASALERVLILDAADAAVSTPRGRKADFALRGAVERWSRNQGIYVIASCAPAPKLADHGLLSGVLLGSMGPDSEDFADSGATVDVTEWFAVATRRAGPLLEKLGLNPLSVQHSTQTKGFPLLALER
jgi:hypothetical protein